MSEKTQESEIVEADFKEKRVLHRLKIEPDGDIAKFFRELAKVSKKEGFKAALVVVIDDQNRVDHLYEGMGEHEAALSALYLEDVSSDLKGIVFNDLDLG